MVRQHPCGKIMSETNMSTQEPNQPNPRATAGGIVLVVVLLVLGAWGVRRLDDSQKAQACIEAGGRRCAVIDPDALPRK